MIKRLLLTIIISAGISNSFASLTVDEVLNEMELQSKTLQNIKFDFHQEIHFFNAAGLTEVTGEAIFQRPGKLHIQKKSPEEQLTVSNGKKIWVYTPAYNQVWEGSAKQWLGAPLLPKGLIPLDNFVEDLRGYFNLKLLEKKSAEGDGLWIGAEPKDKALGYQLELCISTQSWLPVKTVFLSDTAKIVTDLNNMEINLTLSNAMFKFLPPKGADIIPLN